MAEDDIVELLWHNGQIVRRSQTQIPTSDKLSPPPPPSLHILRGSGSGGGEGNALPPLPQQNLFIQEDEMASWLHYPNFCSSVPSTPVTQPQIPVSLAPPLPISSLYDQPAARRVENFINLSGLSRVEAGQWIPVVREPMKVGSSAISLSSATNSSVKPSTFIGGASHTFEVPGLGRKDKGVASETVCEIAGTSSSETKPIHSQPAMEKEIAYNRKQKNREYTIDVSSTPAIYPQIPLSLAQPPPPSITALYDEPAARRVENFMNFSRLRGNMFTGNRVETGVWIPVVTGQMQVGSSAVPLFSATGSSVTPSTVTRGVSHTFAVPDLGRKDKAVAIETVCEIAGTSSSRTEPILSQPAMETEISDDRTRKNREEDTMNVSSTPITLPQIPVSLVPPPPPISALYDQAAARRVENFMNFSRLRGNMFTGSRVEPVQVGPLSSATGFSQTPSKVTGGVSHTVDNVEETREARDSTARKRSRATEMHKLSEKKRRGKINETMKNLQEIIPSCNKTDKASMLEDAVDHVKWLRKQLKMICRGGSMMAPMYQAKMQRFMPHSAMGSMCMNQPPFIPFPRQDHMVGAGPSNPVPHHPFPNNQASDPSRVHFPSQQAGLVSNQPQFPAFGLNQMQQPPPLQNQTASQLSSSQASSSKEPDDQTNQPTG